MIHEEYKHTTNKNKSLDSRLPVGNLAWGFVDNFDVAQFGSSVAGLDCIAGEELSDTLV